VTLLNPWLLLAALPALVALARRRGAHTALASKALAGPLPRSARVALLPLPRALHACAIAAAAVALARPVRVEPLPLRGEGVDIVLCIDVSSSMATEDMEGRTRLAVAREAAAEFVRGRPHDRIGLVTFARFPDLRCPPTLDHDALARILAAVEPVPGDSAEDATGIGAAAAKAAEVLRGAKARSKVAVLLTDGEENVALKGRGEEIAPLHAAQLCEALGVRLHAVAIGDTEARALAEAAARTGGAFLRARDAAGVRDVYVEIDGLERTRIETPGHLVRERFQPFLAAALALLLLGCALQATALEVLP
jgi:Ca-activated chloride channel family protein